jgi:hypothetical protein
LIVASADGVPCARVAFWSLPGRETPLDLVLPSGDWRGDQAALRALMQHVETYFRNAGCDEIGHCQDMPPREPQLQTFEAERKVFLESVGFRVMRHTLRYRCDALAISSTANTTPSANEAPLQLIALNATNEALLIDLVAQVATVSHDELDRSGCAVHGARGTGHGAHEHAKRLIADLREMRVDEDWWRIAYAPTRASDPTSTGVSAYENALAHADKSTEAIGFILPTASADMGTIGYVGVRIADAAISTRSSRTRRACSQTLNSRASSPTPTTAIARWLARSSATAGGVLASGRNGRKRSCDSSVERKRVSKPLVVSSVHVELVETSNHERRSFQW